MTIDFYIHKLLFTNDCVILPGFGGFVGNYAAAKVHPINHTFYPPSKSILFNSKLLQDDGLLIHHISQQENIDYNSAKLNVIDFVADCKSKLEDSKSLDLPMIGKIIKDMQGSLLFDPDPEINYLEESFGLPTFVSPAIVRQPIHKRLEKKFIDRRPVAEHTKSKGTRKWALLAVVPILILATWFTFNFGGNNNTQETAIIPVNESEYIRSEKDHQMKSTEKEIIIDSKSVVPTLALSKNEVSDKSETEAAEMTKAIPAPNYFIVGGAFRNPANSSKMIAKLREKGYDAESAGLSKTGLHMVCYMQTPDKAEALMNLSMIRKKDNPSAWLLKK